MPRPTAVVWDVGNVLYDWDPRNLYRKLIPQPDRLDWFLANVVTHEWHFQHDAGRPFAETSAELIARHPAEADLIRAFAKRWLETISGPTPGTHAIVRALQARQVPQFVITNFSAEFWARFAPHAGILRHFRDIIVSGEVRLVKPDPRIFALARDRFRLGAGAAVFIDDNAANVAAAASAGWHAVQFHSAAALSDELSGLGLL